jgi:hypothetical protein
VIRTDPIEDLFMPALARPGLAAIACVATACNVITPELLGGDGATVVDAPTDAAPPPDATPVPNLRVYYAFDLGGTTAVDDSGHGHHGSVIGGPAWSPEGRRGGALQLGGGTPAAQFVTLPSGMLDGVEDFTIATWLNLPSNVAWARVYDLGNGLADPAQRFMFLTIAGYPGGTGVGLHASSYGGAVDNEIVLSAQAVLPTGVWKHVALTGSGGARTLYVDGHPVVTVTTALDVPPRVLEPIGGNSWLGRSRFAVDPGLIGRLDEFRVYDRVLSTSEVQDLAWPGADYSHWRFDEGGGPTAVDSSDRSVDGTLTAGATWTSGRLGQAIALPGGGATGPHVALGSAPLAGCTSQASVALWVKLTAVANGSRVFDFGTGAGTYVYLAPSDGGVTRVGLGAGGATASVTSATASLPADGAWHHVVVTFDASTVALYVDGFAIATTSGVAIRPGDLAGTTENWFGRSRAGAPSLAGALDEIRIGCRALTGDEIRLLSRR